MQHQEFTIPKKHKIFMKLGFVFFICFTILGIAIFPWNYENQGNYLLSAIISIGCTSLFGVLSILCFKTVRQLPYADICIDEQGIWYKHLTKDHNLVRWRNVSKIRERSIFQCLDILNDRAEQILRIEYQISNFEELRDLIAQHFLSNHKSAEIPNSISKSTAYHFISWLASLLFLLLGYYVASNESTVLGYIITIVLVSIIIHEYVSTPYCLKFNDFCLEIVTPISKKTHSYKDIEAVELSDTFDRGSRIPGVMLKIHKIKKSYMLSKLGVEAIELYTILNIAKYNKCF